MWDFIQDQVLGMKWLNELIGKGVSLLGLDTSSRWGGSVQFFLYDTLKITVLLCILIFGISYVQSYFPPERSKKILGRFHGVWANIIGALLGTVTPFCSCSSIPLYRLYKRRSAFGRDILFPDFLPDGGLGKSGAAYEHFRNQGRHCICHYGSGNRCDRWDAD